MYEIRDSLQKFFIIIIIITTYIIIIITRSVEVWIRRNRLSCYYNSI